MRAWLSFLAVALFAFPSEAALETCRDLPPVEVFAAPRAPLELEAALPEARAATAKELYLHVACGRGTEFVPNPLLETIRRGYGLVYSIPEELIEPLDELTPYLPTVRHLYVRGGGPDLPVLVLLFTDGTRLPGISIDRAVQWSKPAAARVGKLLDLLPYAFLREASGWLSELASFGSTFTVDATLQLKTATYPLRASAVGTAVTSPLGIWLLPLSDHAPSSSLSALTEGVRALYPGLGAFALFAESGLAGLLGEDEFTSFSRRNALFGACPACLPLPFLLRERVAEADEEARRIGYCEAPASCVSRRDGFENGKGLPFGYVTLRARCASWGPLEDFGQSVTVALGATQPLLEASTASAALITPLRDASCETGLTTDRLFQRDDDPDGAILAAKRDYLVERFVLDADRDGVAWDRGAVIRDCDDANPAETRTCGRSCSSGATCALGICVAKQCVCGTQSCEEAGMTCGTLDDDCGTVVTCGTCEEGTCKAGKCVLPP